MTLVWTLRELWSRRLLVAIGMAIATICAILVSFRVGPGLPPQLEPRQYHVGIASAGVLVDSPSSQIADLGTAESKADVVSLSARARLLANLLAASPLKDQIARRAGVPPDRMIAIPPPSIAGSEPSPLATGAAAARGAARDLNVLRVYVNELLPIITADAQAPDPATAARIASGAVTELQLYLRTVAAADKVPNVRQLVLQPLGPARSSLERRGPRRLYSAVAWIMVFGLWCGAILAVSGFARTWRDLSAAEVDGTSPAPSRTTTEAPDTPSPSRAPELESWEVPDRPTRVA